MQRASLWSIQRPSEQALSSREPFAIDTLTFPQWLQFILIEKLRMIIETGLPLPNKMDVAPMAEEAFKQLPENTQQIEQVIKQIDSLINE